MVSTSDYHCRHASRFMYQIPASSIFYKSIFSIDEWMYAQSIPALEFGYCFRSVLLDQYPNRTLFSFLPSQEYREIFYDFIFNEYYIIFTHTPRTYILHLNIIIESRITSSLRLYNFSQALHNALHKFSICT